MANGKWRAEIAKDGIRKSKVHPSKAAAREWAVRAEYLIENGDQVAARQTFGELLGRYAREESPAKRGHRWEVVRLEKFQRDKIAKIQIGDLTASSFADWRDRRLQDVSGSSVRREMKLLSAVLSVARREWQVMSSNPMEGVRQPPESAPRDRRPTNDELDRLQVSAGQDLSNATARAFHAFLFAIETGMRAGEIVGLTADRVDLVKRVAQLPITKNGSAREVGLSSEAVRLIEAMPDLDPVFGLNSAQLDALWRKVRDRAGVENLTFHDSRHEAITRLSKKIDVLPLAKMVGHRDIKMLMTYYEESAEEIAKMLD